MTENDKIYLAGILDYTGAVSMASWNSRSIPFPLVRLGSRERRKIYVVAEILGVDVEAINGTYIISISHRPAQELIKVVSPYLRRTKPIAERALRWAPQKPGPKLPEKVPCPKGCGNFMSRKSKQCQACYAAECSAEPKNFLVEPKIEKCPPTHRTQSGEVTTIGRVQIHTMRR